MQLDKLSIFPSDGGVPEWLKGTGCKPVGYAYYGSNPYAPTIVWLMPMIAQAHPGQAFILDKSLTSG